MNGDFSRDTFNASKHFLRVLMQQGRVQLDADWNEQAAILLHYLQSLAADLIGPHGGPINNFGFGVVPDAARTDFTIGKGHYYVDGILCENEKTALLYTQQADWPGAGKLNTNQAYLVYLDVWERYISMIEDSDIREKALGGPDTASRAKVLWQVKTTDKLPDDDSSIPRDFTLAALNTNWPAWVEKWQPQNRGQLKAQGKQAATDDKNPCVISPDARFRGAENQLYRVEIHSSGFAQGSDRTPTATFKWSRDNGAVVYPIADLNFTTENGITTTTVTVDHLGSEARFAPSEGDWVEILDDDYVLQVGVGSSRAVEKLFKIIKIDPVNRQIMLEGKPSSTVGTDAKKHRFLRRWDHKGGDPRKGGLQLAADGALLIPEEGMWLNLEDGVQILFEPVPSGGGGEVEPHYYRHGDYWLIPARTATGDVEWPNRIAIINNKETLVPVALPPHGVEHHFAPLAIITAAGSVINARRQFNLPSLIPAAASFAPDSEISSPAEAPPRKASKKTGPKTNDEP